MWKGCQHKVSTQQQKHQLMQPNNRRGDWTQAEALWEEGTSLLLQEAAGLSSSRDGELKIRSPVRL